MTPPAEPDGVDVSAPPTRSLAAMLAPDLFPVGRPRPELEADLERDLARGGRVVWLTWLIAFFHGLLGLVAVRQAVMLVDLDSELVTTAPIEELGSTFLAARIALAVVAVVALLLVVRWLPAAARTMSALAGAGGAGHDDEAGDRRRAGIAVLLAPVERPAGALAWSAVRVGSGASLARAALALTILAAAAGLAAAIGLAGAREADAARAWRWVAGAEAVLWILASIVSGAVVTGIGWRLAAAGRAVGVFAPLGDPPGRLAVRIGPALLLFGGLLPIAATAPTIAATDCPGTILVCGSVVVPVRHGGGPDQPTISIVYGVHEATRDRKGALVIAVGGPGASGLKSAEPRLDGFPEELVARYDIVFWDQRGIGDSDGHDCPVSGGLYSAVAPDAESARAFVDACLREAGTGPIDLGRYATTQAAEDLETIRQRLGLARFVLYGESYGTELAQVYAAAYPDRISALILDGAVDLTLTANDFWSAATHSFDDTLAATFERCLTDSLCRADVRDPARAYDRLLGRLADGPVVATYADPTGIATDHSIDQRAVEGAVASLMYEPFGRSLVLRAIAASAGGDFVPIGRLVDLFGPGINPGFSTFAYHAILCADYRVSPTDDVADIDAVLEYGRATGALATRTDEVYFAQVPCLFWPVQPSSPERPAPLTTLAAPIIVLGAELDPITPMAFGRAIAARAADGYFIESSGGPHVTFGRGNVCVDSAIEHFLLDDVLPRQRTTHCTDVVAEEYIPLTALDAADYRDALEAMTSLEDELLADPLNAIWQGTGSIAIGCRYSGAVLVSFSDATATYEFNGCEFARGMPLDGTGRSNHESGAVSFEVTFPGGELRYTSDGATFGVRTVSGSFRGRAVDVQE
ncbi:MAG TPA: alpha/beta fold hydrolase [Candidatus Limnocylindrales bacterium]|nr:alpha/beta fold hydrolase [Candidatus Limnocylindrales bacterium]